MFFSTNLQFLRKATGSMTQERLAEKLGVSRQTVSKWESGEGYPEIPKLLELCSIFSCKLDDLLRQDMAARASIYAPVEIRRVEPFRMARYVMISPNPEDDVMAYMDSWAEKSGLTGFPGYAPVLIGWDFPYVSQEQKNRFGLRGYGCACILPEDFEPECGGAEILRQEAADYAVMTIRDPFAAAFDRIPHAYQLILEFLGGNRFKKKHKDGILPCFEHVYTRGGVTYMDVYIHCDTAAKPDKVIRFA